MVNKVIRDQVFKRDKYKCVSCGCKEKIFLTLDHIIPQDKGGKDTLKNLETYCLQCNILKANKDKISFDKIKEHLGELRLLGAINITGNLSITYPLYAPK